MKKTIALSVGSLGIFLSQIAAANTAHDCGSIVARTYAGDSSSIEQVFRRSDEIYVVRVLFDIGDYSSRKNYEVRVNPETCTAEPRELWREIP